MKSRAKAKTETIKVEIDGEVYRGERIVTGRHDLRQEVRFEALGRRDPNDYVVGDVAFMRDIARVMLRDLVEQSRRQGRRRPVKVEPREKPRRLRTEK